MILKVGDKVLWTNQHGITVEIVVVGIQELYYNEHTEELIGRNVQEIDWKNKFVVDLENDKWAYNYQIKPIYLNE